MPEGRQAEKEEEAQCCLFFPSSGLSPNDVFSSLIRYLRDVSHGLDLYRQLDSVIFLVATTKIRYRGDELTDMNRGSLFYLFSEF